ncbi:MAG: DUF3040 domain-containing protein [Actinomycetota bacterium]|nr:DUF3040 domain-containing protein [Actinomycetota bacterium]
MPLSEHEQRLLEQMERALYAEDPKLASALRGADPRTHARRRVALAGLAFLIGVAVLMGGVVAKIIPLGVVGFVLMVAAAFAALSNWRAMPSAAERRAARGGTASPRASRGPGRTRGTRDGFMNRLEERWNRRRDQNGR